MSFLSPRVLIDNGNEIYFVILHDNGYVELAILKNNVFYSAVIYQFADYSLLNPSNSINVEVARQLDNVNVNINGKSSISFPISPTIANVSLTSEKSTALFSNINLTTEDTMRLFAVRQNLTPIKYTAENEGSESSTIKVTSKGDFAIVSQYLYNNQREAMSNLPNTVFKANVFFQGWIFNNNNGLTNQKITISITGQQAFLWFNNNINCFRLRHAYVRSETECIFVAS